MKFWVKTANVKRALKCIEYGIFEGVISNPGDVSLENVEPKKKLQELMQKRKSLYESIADTIVKTEGHKPYSLAKQVIENFDAHRNSKP